MRRGALLGALFLVLVQVLVALFALPIKADQAATPAALPTECAGRDAGAIAAIVQKRYDGVKDIAARFEQTTRSVVMGGVGIGADAPTTGTVQIAKPGRMRWHYQSPRESLVISDGETLWIYDVGVREATRAPVTGGYLAGAALEFLLGEGTLVESFEVRLLGCSGDEASMELRPKEAAGYEWLELQIAVEGGEVRGTAIHDLFGNATRLRFDDLQFNQSPPLERFQFSPPDGVEVIDLGPPS